MNNISDMYNKLKALNVPQIENPFHKEALRLKLLAELARPVDPKVIPFSIWRLKAALPIAAGLAIAVTAYFAIFRPNSIIPQAANINHSEGEVVIYRDNHNPVKFKKKNVLQNGDTIMTEINSFAAVAISGRTRVSLNEKSVLQIRKIKKSRAGAVCRLELRSGRVTCHVEKSQWKRFEVFTPTAVVTAIGTVFTVEVRENGDLKVSVINGAVTINPCIDSSTKLSSDAEKKSNEENLELEEPFSGEMFDPYLNAVAAGESILISQENAKQMRNSLYEAVTQEILDTDDLKPSVVPQLVTQKSNSRQNTFPAPQKKLQEKTPIPTEKAVVPAVQTLPEERKPAPVEISIPVTNVPFLNAGKPANRLQTFLKWLATDHSQNDSAVDGDEESKYVNLLTDPSVEHQQNLANTYNNHHGWRAWTWNLSNRQPVLEENISITRDHTRTGKYAIKFICENTNERSQLWHRVDNVVPLKKKNARFSFYYRSEEFSKTGTFLITLTSCKLNRNENKYVRLNSERETLSITSENDGWQFFSIETVNPIHEEADELQISIYQIGGTTGTYYFDDFVLVPAESRTASTISPEKQDNRNLITDTREGLSMGWYPAKISNAAGTYVDHTEVRNGQQALVFSAYTNCPAYTYWAYSISDTAPIFGKRLAFSCCYKIKDMTGEGIEILIRSDTAEGPCSLLSVRKSIPKTFSGEWEKFLIETEIPVSINVQKITIFIIFREETAGTAFFTDFSLVPIK